MAAKPLRCTLFLALLIFLFNPIFLPFSYGQDPSIDIIINEVELNSSQEKNSRMWIELLNKGGADVQLSNLSLIILIGEEESGNVTQTFLSSAEYSALIQPGNHFAITLQEIEYDDHISLQLFADGILLDEVEGLRDNVRDDRTWQRYPDGLDTGNFEDWIFNTSTKSKDNGNLGKAIAECYLDPVCMNLDIPTHQKTVLRINGTEYTIGTFSTSLLNEMHFDQNGKKLVISTVESGEESSLSFLHLTFPHVLLNGEFVVHLDQVESPYPFFIVNNSSHSRLLLEYPAGNRTIEIYATNIVPEFDTICTLVLTISFLGIIAAKLRYTNSK